MLFGVEHGRSLSHTRDRLSGEHILISRKPGVEDSWSRIAGDGNTISVMAGLVPAIHVFSLLRQGVDAHDKRGHDDST
jgi:hypothetical protein